MFLGDYHTHTVYSHGKGTVEDNVRAAIAAGLKQLAITDHGFRHLTYNVRRGDWPYIMGDVEAARQKYPQIDIFLGLETNFNSLGRQYRHQAVRYAVSRRGRVRVSQTRAAAHAARPVRAVHPQFFSQFVRKDVGETDGEKHRRVHQGAGKVRHRHHLAHQPRLSGGRRGGGGGGGRVRHVYRAQLQEHARRTSLHDRRGAGSGAYDEGRIHRGLGRARARQDRRFRPRGTHHRAGGHTVRAYSQLDRLPAFRSRRKRA